MFSSCFFVCWKYCKVPIHLQLLVKWDVVSPNSRYREFYHEIGNIEKCPFTYWLNGRWFLQIVDINVGNFNMKLTGRWFPQIVDRDSGNLYPIYIYNKNCGVSFWTCSREISGDRVALLLYEIYLNSLYWAIFLWGGGGGAYKKTLQFCDTCSTMSKRTKHVLFHIDKPCLVKPIWQKNKLSTFQWHQLSWNILLWDQLPCCYQY